MNTSIKILWKSLVKPFYRENAGPFFFWVTVMFCAVGRQSGAGLIEYHYALILGMLNDAGYFLVVCLIWALYVRRCAAFVIGTLQNPSYLFLRILTRLPKATCFRLFFFAQLLLFIPVLLYASLIIGVAIHHEWYMATALIVLVIILLCAIPAAGYLYYLGHPEKTMTGLLKRGSLGSRFTGSYWQLLIRFIFSRLKVIVLGIKVFTCGLLYLTLRNNAVTEYDIQLSFLFFSFGVFANGVVVHRIREFEETSLFFYRGAPVSLINRLSQYAIVYFLLFLPEIVTIVLLPPEYLRYNDAIAFAFCGYGILLLMNSITFVAFFTMKEYLKLIFLIFCTLYIFLIAFSLTVLYLLFFILAVVIFLTRYYQYQHRG